MTSTDIVTRKRNHRPQLLRYNFSPLDHNPTYVPHGFGTSHIHDSPFVFEKQRVQSSHTCSCMILSAQWMAKSSLNSAVADGKRTDDQNQLPLI
jgi:hypothetical protein